MLAILEAHVSDVKDELLKTLAMSPLEYQSEENLTALYTHITSAHTIIYCLRELLKEGKVEISTDQTGYRKKV